MHLERDLCVCAARWQTGSSSYQEEGWAAPISAEQHSEPCSACPGSAPAIVLHTHKSFWCQLHRNKTKRAIQRDWKPYSIARRRQPRSYLAKNPPCSMWSFTCKKRSSSCWVEHIRMRCGGCGRLRLDIRKKFFTLRAVRHCTDCTERWCRHLRSGNGALSTDGAVGVPAQCRGWIRRPLGSLPTPTILWFYVCS